jgi:voltage-gated potassium channel
VPAATANEVAVHWEQDASGRVATPFEPLVLVATLSMIPVLIIERDAHSHPWRTFAYAANWAIWGVFALELVFILVVAPRKLAALRRHWLDAAIVFLTPPIYGRLLSSLRLARLLRLLRLLRAVALVGRALQAERRLTSESVFRFVGIATVFLVFIAGAVEATVDEHDFKSFWEGVWWAITTVTTVGYGDVVPHSVAGRLVAMALMLVGIGFVAVLTATIASMFVKADTRGEDSEIREALARIEGELAALKADLRTR